MIQKLDVEFMDNEDECYSLQETNLENRIQIALNNNLVDQNDEDISFYLDERRSRLISWYPFTGKVLEIGAGFGTFTGYLCNQCAHVTALEIKKERYQILKKRYSDTTNLQLLNLNIKNFTSTKKFNYIFIHDIVGYLKKYYKTDNYMQVFLNQMYNLLDENGKLLIETENRYGIQYFAGCIEEYSKQPYTSLTNFNAYDYIRTFSKSEWETLIKLSKFKSIKFYYPYPNVDYISEIQTDFSLKILPFSNIYYKDNYSNKYAFFNYKSILNQSQNNINSFFSNSFFIEISKCDCENIIYCNFNFDNKLNKFYKDYKDNNLLKYLNTVDSIEDLLTKRFDVFINNKIKQYFLLGLKDKIYQIALNSISTLYNKINFSNIIQTPMSFRDVFFINENEVCLLLYNQQLSVKQFKDIIGTWYVTYVLPNKKLVSIIKINDILAEFNIEINFAEYYIDDLTIVNPINEEADFLLLHDDNLNIENNNKISKLKKEKYYVEKLRKWFDDNR